MGLHESKMMGVLRGEKPNKKKQPLKTQSGNTSVLSNLRKNA